MAGKKQLRPVKPGEKAPPQSFSESIERGSRLDELRAMRRVLAAHIDSENTLARDLAPLMRQAREISSEIESLEEVEREQNAVAKMVSGSDDAKWGSQAI